MTKQEIFMAGVVAVLMTVLVGLSVFSQSVRWMGEPFLVVNPSGKVPLSVLVQSKTDRKVELVIEIFDGENKRIVTSKEKSTDHSIPLLNFKSDKKYTLRVTAQQARAKSTELEFVTPPLPDDFPPITTKISVPERMEDGITLFNVMRWDVGITDLSYGLIVMRHYVQKY